DASSGECLQTLEGHRDSVKSVAFSHDSARLAGSTNLSIAGPPSKSIPRSRETGLMEKRGWDANTFPFLTPGDLDMSSIISIPTLFVFDFTEEWKLLTSPRRRIGAWQAGNQSTRTGEVLFCLAILNLEAL